MYIETKRVFIEKEHFLKLFFHKHIIMYNRLCEKIKIQVLMYLLYLSNQKYISFNFTSNRKGKKLNTSSVISRLQKYCNPRKHGLNFESADTTTRSLKN